MCVNFCCSYTFVPHHALDGTKVGSTLQQMGSKRMAEGVGANVFGDAGTVGQLLDEVEYHDARDAVAPTGKEEGVFVSGLDTPLLRSCIQ